MSDNTPILLKDKSDNIMKFSTILKHNNMICNMQLECKSLYNNYVKCKLTDHKLDFDCNIYLRNIDICIKNNLKHF